MEKKTCVDIGSVNCPCPLAETGDCILCSRLRGLNECDCNWSGVCVFNEYIQNDKKIRGLRQEKRVAIINKIMYAPDLFVLILDVGRGFALTAAKPGSFVFLRNEKKPDYYGVPLSVMKTDQEKGHIYLVLKVISAKTKTIAEADESIIIRGIYRNGILGGGIGGMEKNTKISDHNGAVKWLIFTKGVGFAPAVNLLNHRRRQIAVDMIIDTDKICQDIVLDYLDNLDVKAGSSMSVRFQPLGELLETIKKTGTEGLCDSAKLYDKIMIMTSDYYIEKIKEELKIPDHKLIYSNNFRMCCGEGICGACSFADDKGEITKMCKCTDAGAMPK